MKKQDENKVTEWATAKGEKIRLSFFAKKTTRIALAVILAVALLTAVFVPLGILGYFEPEPESVFSQKKEKGFSTDDIVFNTVSVSSSTTGTFAKFIFVYNDKEYTVHFYLLSKYAPKTVQNFISYANQKAYNNTVIYDYRMTQEDNGSITKGYLQGGMYTLTDEKVLCKKQPPTYLGKVVGEFPANGHSDNNINNSTGILGMVRNTEDYDSGDTEFYILPAGDTSLNGYYAPFGIITDTDSVSDLLLFLRAMSNAEKESYPVTLKSVTIYTK